METKISKTDNYTLIGIVGRIDTVTAVEFEKAVSQALVTEDHAIVIDCSGMDYISSSGLRVFLMLQKKMSAKKGLLHLCCLQPNIREIFDISGFSGIFKLFTDLSSATALS